MSGKQSKSVAPVQTEAVPPYSKVKQLVGRFENGSLRAKNGIVTDPSSQEHVIHLETSLQAINQLIYRIDRLEESADKTPLFLELMQVFSQLRYHSLMRSDALNRGITVATEKVAPICSEDEFNELRLALDPQLLSTASPLVADVISGPLAGRANIVEANPGTGYNIIHGFSKKKERDQLTETGTIFFTPLEEERTNRILSKFLHCVARGEQEKAEKLLKINNEWLLKPGIFTDYSGRTFNCTAYEYAYWAKDTHMQRMLEKYMDADIGRYMLGRIAEMERIDEVTGQPVGLTYYQNGQEYHSVHFDSQKLIQALQAYVTGYDGWVNTSNWAAMDAAWLKVGFAQRDVVVHIANEYCRPDRSFDPMPPFNEPTLPRILSFRNWTTGRDESWFPLAAPDSGLGFDFGLARARRRAAEAGRRMARWACMDAALDSAAVTRLDEVRTAGLTQSRENLNSLAGPHGLSR